MTVRDLIKQASIMAGLTDPFEDLNANDNQYGFDKLNQLVDLWATQRLSVYRRQRTGPFTVTASTADYSIGVGATWDVARPIWIDAASVIYTASDPNVEIPMQILTLLEWQRVGTKAATSTFPQMLFYDRRYNSSGYGLITVYPVPTENSQIVLYLPIAVTEFATLSETLALPPGYRAALVSNLAETLLLGVREVPPDVAKQAALTFGSVKSANVVAHMDPLLCDQAVTRQAGSPGFNFLTGNIN